MCSTGLSGNPESALNLGDLSSTDSSAIVVAAAKYSKNIICARLRRFSVMIGEVFEVRPAQRYSLRKRFGANSCT